MMTGRIQIEMEKAARAYYIVSFFVHIIKTFVHTNNRTTPLK